MAEEEKKKGPEVLEPDLGEGRSIDDIITEAQKYAGSYVRMMDEANIKRVAAGHEKTERELYQTAHNTHYGKLKAEKIDDIKSSLNKVLMDYLAPMIEKIGKIPGFKKALADSKFSTEDERLQAIADAAEQHLGIDKSEIIGLPNKILYEATTEDEAWATLTSLVGEPAKSGKMHVRRAQNYIMVKLAPLQNHYGSLIKVLEGVPEFKRLYKVTDAGLANKLHGAHAIPILNQIASGKLAESTKGQYGLGELTEEDLKARYSPHTA